MYFPWLVKKYFLYKRTAYNSIMKLNDLILHRCVKPWILITCVCRNLVSDHLASPGRCWWELFCPIHPGMPALFLQCYPSQSRTNTCQIQKIESAWEFCYGHVNTMWTRHACLYIPSQSLKQTRPCNASVSSPFAGEHRNGPWLIQAVVDQDLPGGAIQTSHLNGVAAGVCPVHVAGHPVYSQTVSRLQPLANHSLHTSSIQISPPAEMHETEQCEATVMHTFSCYLCCTTTCDLRANLIFRETCI